MAELAFQTTCPDLAPRDAAGVEWWFVQGRLTMPGGRRLHLMAALFLIRGLRAEGPPGAMLIQHVLDETTGDGWVDSRLTPAAIDHHERIARDVAAGMFAPPLRGLALWRHGRDMDALMLRTGMQVDHSAPRFDADPFSVSWNGFSLRRDGPGLGIRFAMGPGRAVADLALTPQSPWMDERSDRLHPDLGNGFAYQCCPHLSATGTMDGAPVSGEFWVDRQWGRMDGWLVEPAEPGRRVLGWEWFGINFDSGHHLMIFRHNRAGRSDPARQCAVSFQDGPPRRLDRIEAQVLGNWISPVTGARYPVEWGFSLPEIDLQLRISPLTLNQEIPVFGSTAIWEGAARVTGRQGGHEIGGRARMELVGYGAPLSIADHVGRRLRRLQGDLLGDRLGSLLSAPQNRRR